MISFFVSIFFMKTERKPERGVRFSFSLRFRHRFDAGGGRNGDENGGTFSSCFGT
jgi:hypothetical protein